MVSGDTPAGVGGVEASGDPSAGAGGVEDSTEEVGSLSNS